MARRALARARWPLWAAGGLLIGAAGLLPLWDLDLDVHAAVVGKTLFCRTRLYRRLDSTRLADFCFGASDLPQGVIAEVPSLVHVTSLTELWSRRQKLIRYIWGTDALPTDRLPSDIVHGIDDPGLADLANLERIDLLEMEMPHDFVARAYHLLPRHGNGRLAIYHGGHIGSFRTLGKETLAGLLAHGFAVLAFDMPMRGVNSWPERIDVPELGSISLASGAGWNLWPLETDTFKPLQYFLDPVLRGVDYVERTYDYDAIVMLGVSGGGWTSTVYPALDPRIVASYPIAGSLPFSLLRQHPVSHTFTSEGAYEQRLPDFYRLANYLDLYVMASAGGGRRVIQILNKYDPCCFFGEDGKAYAPAVAAAVTEVGLGGDFRVFSDGSHMDHALSAAGLDLILEDAAR